MKSTTIALFTKVASLPSGTKVAELALMSGSDVKDKTRYLNGSFIITKKTKGIDEVVAAIDASTEEKLLVEVEISNLFAEASAFNEKTYINYKGLLNSIVVKPKKTSE